MESPRRIDPFQRAGVYRLLLLSDDSTPLDGCLCMCICPVLFALALSRVCLRCSFLLISCIHSRASFHHYYRPVSLHLVPARSFPLCNSAFCSSACERPHRSCFPAAVAQLSLFPVPPAPALLSPHLHLHLHFQPSRHLLAPFLGVIRTKILAYFRATPRLLWATVRRSQLPERRLGCSGLGLGLLPCRPLTSGLHSRQAPAKTKRINSLGSPRTP